MRSKGLGALVLSAVMIGLAVPASALAAKPTVTTGGAGSITFSSARLNGTVDPNKQATAYFFQYGTTIALGAQTATRPPAPVTRACTRAWTWRAWRPRRSTSTAWSRATPRAPCSGSGAHSRPPPPATRRLTLATPNPVKASNSTTISAGRSQGPTTPVAGSSCRPAHGRIPRGSRTHQRAGHEHHGRILVPVLSSPNTQYRVQMPERPQVVSPIVSLGVKPSVKSKVNKRRVQRGKRIRFSGRVTRGRRTAVAFQK